MDYNTSLSSSRDDQATVVHLETATLINETVCNPLSIPSIRHYFTAFNALGFALFSIGGLALLTVLILYVDTVRHIIKSAPTSAKGHSVFVISVYPIVSIATYCATIVPRAQLVAEAVTQGMFMACLYQLFCLIVAYSGGEAQLVKKVHPNNLSLQVAPCCCWPFCSFLPTFTLTKKKLNVLRLLVLQLPVVQGLTYMALLVMWAEEQSLYHINYSYFQPVVVISILLGIWGIVMTVKVTLPVLQEYHIQGKFIALQLVLLFAKFQGFIAKFVAMGDIFPCKPPITPLVYSNLIYNSAILWEMVILCTFARFLYKKALPEFYPTDSNSNIPKQISTITEKSAKTVILNDKTISIKF
ncbi:organic solute transporter alpha-like protein [Rhodnius prolixus]|uniref:organic solute transporter alpha-like protein n=1 Tax=Rhodnius prolixus TaxID=13249 RepID=UPI003D18C9AC